MDRLRYWVLLAALAVLPLTACGAASAFTSRPFSMLKRMQAQDYFNAPLQIELAEAIEREDIERMQRAINSGADVNAVGKEEMRPLFWAMSKQKLTAFKFLLDKGASTNPAMTFEDSGRRRTVGAIEMAAIMENPEYLRALLDHRADPNALMNNSKEPVIFRAVMHQRLENLKLLVEHGANVNQQDTSGMTALATAVNISAYQIALYLLRTGADPTLATNWGASAVDSVKKFDDRAIIRNNAERTAHGELIAELTRRGLLK